MIKKIGICINQEIDNGVKYRDCVDFILASANLFESNVFVFFLNDSALMLDQHDFGMHTKDYQKKLQMLELFDTSLFVVDDVVFYNKNLKFILPVEIVSKAKFNTFLKKCDLIFNF
ncbi:MAG: hypothetical protein R3Y52_01960 [Psittacicella sp.]